MFRALGGKSEDWMVWVEQWAKQKRKGLLVARAGTECWTERLLFPLWSLGVSNALGAKARGPERDSSGRGNLGAVCAFQGR